MKKNKNSSKEPAPMEYKEAFDIMMKNTDDSVFFKDKECRFIYVSNAQLKRLNETKLENVIGKTDFEFFPKEDATEYFNREQQIMQTGIPILDDEKDTIWANGDRSWVKISKYPLYDKHHRIVGVWGVSTDITSQKNAELIIRESEERYRMLSEVTIEGILIHKNGKIEDANPSVLKMFGFEREEVLQKDIIDFVYEDDKDTARENMAKQYQHPFEIRTVKKSGEVFFAEVESRTFRTNGDSIRMASVRDISKRKKAEDLLHESVMQMRAITDSAYDAILMMDHKGNISYWNPAAERIFGYTKKEALGKSLHKLIVPACYRDAFAAAFPAFRKTGNGNAVGKTLDMQGIRKDGMEISIQLSLSAVNMSSGWNAIGILRDVTGQKLNEIELVRAKEIAEEATGAKSEFLANMSHEIRTPMNAVIGFTGLMKKTKMTQKQQDYIHKIDSSANSLLGIINDILDFSKIEAGKLELEKVGFHLNDVIENIVSMLSVKAAEKNIELLNRIANDVPCALIGDPLRLGQILVNLVNNAVKFTEKGQILMKTELIRKNDALCKIKFSVQDTGIGLTDEQKSKLFAAFSQGDSSVTRRFGGTGLGLTISKRLVEMMNGEIFVESEFGIGSTFTFIVDFMMQPENAENKLFEMGMLCGKKVLVVDDNEMSREILKEQIVSFGVEVISVDSGRKAILEIQNESKKKPYDLVFMDWNMPDMNGIEAARIILDDKTLSKMPQIIMLSAFGREEVVKKAEKIGISAFLMKPVSQSLLLDTIMNICGMDMKGPFFQKGEEDIENENNEIEGVRILLVEDNVLNQEVAMEILTSAGAIVSIANNGKEAVEAVGELPLDVVLMDLQMPIMGGYEAARTIRSDERYAALPIIAMTAHAMQGIKEECAEAGMNDYVSKPIEPKHLFAVIKKWTKGKVVRGEQQIKNAVEINKDNKPFVVLPKSVLGVDIEAGLGRVNGNRELYRKLLIDFGDNYSSCADDIKKALEQSDLESARLLAHTLKGVAGNISAYEIQNIAALLEEEMLKDTAEKQDERINKLNEALKSFSRIIKGVKESVHKEESIIEKPIHPMEVGPVLRQLAHFVWEDNIDAESSLDELKKKIGGSRFSKEILSLSECIGNYDFDAAKEPLQKIAKELNIGLGEQKNE